MGKRRVRKRLVIKIGLILFIILGIFLGVKFYIYRTSNEYKLKTLGYTKNEVTTLIDHLDKTAIKKVLTIDYNKNLDNIIIEKYFIYNNLDRYLAYLKVNPDKTIKDVVAIVNTNNDHDHYTKIIKTDTTKENLMLVNKYYYLTNTFVPKNLTNMSLTYAYEEQAIGEEVYNNFIALSKAAKKDGFTLVANSSYRDYKTQEGLYQQRVNAVGEEAADSSVARPGHSEHETGLALDITGLYQSGDVFTTSAEYTWMLENAYIYGFILRYPEDKEYLTGYEFEAWHYRYVGQEVATKLKDLGITFDEYYAYYIK